MNESLAIIERGGGVITEKLRAKDFLAVILSMNKAAEAKGEKLTPGNVAYAALSGGVDPKSALKTYFKEVCNQKDAAAKNAVSSFMNGENYRKAERATVRNRVDTQFDAGRHLKSMDKNSINFTDPYKVKTAKPDPFAQLEAFKASERKSLTEKLLAAGMEADKIAAIVALI